MVRQLHLHPLKSPATLTVLDRFNRFHREEICRLPGQAAAIRFFDADSQDDFTAVNDILTGPGVKAWMDESGKLTRTEYRNWAGRHTADSFLFAVHDSRLATAAAIRTVRGFVNLYSEREEKFRIKRLQKAGLLPADLQAKTTLETSLGARVIPTDPPSAPGLMSSALRQSCLQVKSLLGLKPADLILYGFADPANPASARALEAAGFVLRGQTLYDPDSPAPSLFYLLRWPRLIRKTKTNMVNRVGSYVKVIPEAQQTDSHCGPAVVKGLLRYHRLDVTQDQVVDTVNIKKFIRYHGMRPTQIYQAVSQLAPHLRFWFKQAGTIKDLYTLIHQYNLPVGINWQGLFYDTVREETKKKPHGDNGHYSIIVDVNRTTRRITIDDPYTDYFDLPRIFSYRWFKSRWWDTDTIKQPDLHTKTLIRTHRLLFVIAPKDFRPPASLHLLPGSRLIKLERQLFTSPPTPSQLKQN